MILLRICTIYLLHSSSQIVVSLISASFFLLRYSLSNSLFILPKFSMPQLLLLSLYSISFVLIEIVEEAQALQASRAIPIGYIVALQGFLSFSPNLPSHLEMKHNLAVVTSLITRGGGLYLLIYKVVNLLRK